MRVRGFLVASAALATVSLQASAYRPDAEPRELREARLHQVSSRTHIHLPFGAAPGAPTESFSRLYWAAEEAKVKLRGRAFAIGPRYTSAVFRERGEELPDLEVLGNARDFPDEPLRTESSGSRRRGMARILRALYQSYARQGDGRQDIVERVVQQDILENAAGRVTHFLTYTPWVTEAYSPQARQHLFEVTEPLGHVQALISRDASEEPLHCEESLAEAGHPIVRAPGEILAEVGRLSMLDDPESAQRGDARDIEWHRVYHLRTILRELHSWMGQDTSINRAFYQAKPMMLKRLRQIGFPLEAARATYEIRTGKNKTVREKVLEFDRAGIHAIEDALSSRLIGLQLERFVGADPGENDLLQLVFRPNQIASLKRLGAIEWTDRARASSLPEPLQQKSLVALPNDFHLPEHVSRIAPPPDAKVLGPILLHGSFVDLIGFQKFREGTLDRARPVFALDRARRADFEHLHLQFTPDAARAMLDRLADDAASIKKVGGTF